MKIVMIILVFSGSYDIPSSTQIEGFSSIEVCERATLHIKHSIAKKHKYKARDAVYSCLKVN